MPMTTLVSKECHVVRCTDSCVSFHFNQKWKRRRQLRSFVVGVEGCNGKREKMPHCKLCRVSKYVCVELFAEDFKEFLLRIAINTNSAESTNVFSLYCTVVKG